MNYSGTLATPDVGLKQNNPPKKRAQFSATFEVMPRLFGLNENVMLDGIQVEDDRKIVRFFVSGSGLEEYEDMIGQSLNAFEGQESYSIIPPSWQAAIEN